MVSFFEQGFLWPTFGELSCNFCQSDFLSCLRNKSFINFLSYNASTPKVQNGAPFISGNMYSESVLNLFIETILSVFFRLLVFEFQLHSIAIVFATVIISSYKFLLILELSKCEYHVILMMILFNSSRYA